ncbi:MAG: MarR family transcriptional regulator [Bryobacteraceae bacterium]
MSRSESRLQAELKQSRPFASPLQEAFLSVLKTADLLTHVLDQHLASHDLRHQQYNVLRILRGAGPEGIPTLAIADRLIECTPGMTRLLDRMEQKGLVLRKRCPDDRRQVLCYATAQGNDLLDRLEPMVKTLVDQFFERIQPAELETFIETMERIREQAAAFKRPAEPQTHLN